MTDKDISRHLTPVLAESLTTSRVVNLIGPRQVGKTTLVRDLYGKGIYLTLDDAGVLAAVEADPSGQLTSLMADVKDGPLIIDEAQRSTELALAIKAIVDKDRKKGQFLITGSSNVFANMKVADSLAGRMVTEKLWPLTAAEIKHALPNQLLDWALSKSPSLKRIKPPEELTRDDYITLILQGGFPEPRELAERQRQTLYRNYINSIVDRDVADLLRVRKTDKLRLLIDQMAARTGQEINVSELSGVVGIKRETVDTYLDVLERLSLLLKLGAWTSGESRREVKQPKYHFVDTGMNCALRRFKANSFDANSANASQLGGLLESYIFNELLRALPHLDNEFRLYHWRSADHREIDIIADAGAHLVGIEVKSAATVSTDDFKHLKWFAAQGPGRTRDFTGIVFYLGTQKLSFGDNCFAIPVSGLWSDIRT